jgi:hypothetical protein
MNSSNWLRIEASNSIPGKMPTRWGGTRGRRSGVASVSEATLATVNGQVSTAAEVENERARMEERAHVPPKTGEEVPSRRVSGADVGARTLAKTGMRRGSGRRTNGLEGRVRRGVARTCEDDVAGRRWTGVGLLGAQRRRRRVVSPKP